MKKLTSKQLTKLDKAYIEASKQPSTWDPFYEKYMVDATINIPCGEIMNDKISGCVWAWQLKGFLKPLPIVDSDSFDAQGLEGKCTIKSSIFTACLVSRYVLPSRLNVWLEAKDYNRIKDLI